MLVKRISINFDLNPFATACNHRQRRSSCRYDPHIVLQLRHVLFRRRFFRERPWQHELGFECGAAAGNPTIKSTPSIEASDAVPIAVV
jgi:hypothetical protein